MMAWAAALALAVAAPGVLAAQEGAATAAARQQAVDALFAEVDRADSPGAAVGIYHRGELVYANGYGRAHLEYDVPITPRTIFHVASVSKQFAAFSVALLAREGKVDLDAEARRYLPYLPDFGHRLTVRHLVYHTSGLRDQWSLFSIGGQAYNGLLRQEQIVNMAERQQALNFEPGTEFTYSNLGYSMLAEIVHAASGRTLREFTTERIFRPLGMDRTFFFDDVTEIVPGRSHSYVKADAAEDGADWKRALLNFDNVGATSLFTTVEDLAKWAGNFARPVAGDAALIEQFTTMGTLDDGTAINYGFALWQATFAGHRAVMHTGSDAGYRAFFAYVPEEDFAVAILANVPVLDRNEIADAIVDLYLNDGTGTARTKNQWPAAAQPDAEALRRMAGTYLSPYGPLVTLAVEGGSLVWRTASGQADTLVIRVDGTFDAGSRWGSHYRWVRDDRGGIVGFEEVPGFGGGVTLYQRAQPVRPPAAELAELAGDYRSPELDVTYTFAVEDGQLTARSIWQAEPIRFTPSVEDRFDSLSGPLGTVMVERDARGRATAFRVYTGRVRHLLLERVSAP